MKITKKLMSQFVKAKLASDEKWAKKALLAIYENQTEDEQLTSATNHLNGVGFGGADAFILTRFAIQLKTRDFLSPKQMELVFHKIPRYSRQIIELSDSSKLEALITKQYQETV